MSMNVVDDITSTRCDLSEGAGSGDKTQLTMNLPHIRIQYTVVATAGPITYPVPPIGQGPQSTLTPYYAIADASTPVNVLSVSW